MISTPYVVATARVVRIATATLAAGLLIGFVAISSFWSHYGDARSTVVRTGSDDTALAAAVLEQESAGLVCSDKPVPTEIVLFQSRGSATVQILTFDEAIRATSTREGSIRSYCSMGSRP